jgi:hypothetical protein
MTKRQIETTLRVAGRIAKEREFFLIGSQALHAWARRVPAEALLSQECDLYPKNVPEAVTVLALALGRRSRFARSNGFYADVVTPELATLPPNWQMRVRRWRVGAVTALCLEVHDLVVSKLAAGRLKDLEFIGAVLKLRLAKLNILRRRIAMLPSNADRQLIRSRLDLIIRELRS